LNHNSIKLLHLTGKWTRRPTGNVIEYFMCHQATMVSWVVRRFH